jgi:hypothetical protein
MSIAHQLKWLSARLVFVAFALAWFFSGGLLAYIFGPIYSWYVFGDIRFWRYRPLVFPIWRSAWRQLGEWLRTPKYRHMLAIPVISPPRVAPDPELVRVRSVWLSREDSCSGCVKCCSHRRCALLDTEKMQCRSYGSFFWRYFNCGRYPETEIQIQYYSCGKWELAR